MRSLCLSPVSSSCVARSSINFFHSSCHKTKYKYQKCLAEHPVARRPLSLLLLLFLPLSPCPSPSPSYLHSGLQPPPFLRPDIPFRSLYAHHCPPVPLCLARRGGGKGGGKERVSDEGNEWMRSSNVGTRSGRRMTREIKTTPQKSKIRIRHGWTGKIGGERREGGTGGGGKGGVSYLCFPFFERHGR